eukprot:TRINITY_DN63988_c0_g1_i1.p1 TRINITY_DN63988_c0_g1~~TRINITY_DN63988_c0_g1_i1.p1  ORF type:complete len:241 (-),score=31.55 TRINITY_DN63988_c0_g1_i1:74-796(-)
MATPAKSGWENLMDSEPDKKYGAHNDRNQEPILEVLLKHLPDCAPIESGSAAKADKADKEPVKVLEVACGTGQHSAFLVAKLANVKWHPTDYDPRCLKSTDLWTEELRNIVTPAAHLDVTSSPSTWPVPASSVDVVYNCNMIHLAPIIVMHGFCAGAGEVLKPGGKLFLYGPFSIGGKHVSEGNVEFDNKLRARDPSWGIRSVEEVTQEMAKNNLEFVAQEAMPANNFTLVFQKFQKSDL